MRFWASAADSSVLACRWLRPASTARARTDALPAGSPLKNASANLRAVQTYGKRVAALVAETAAQSDLASGRDRAESRQQEISEISRSLKGLARELNVPVVALSQLSRAPESRNDHRPMLSDLRESGAIEQDADLVMFLYRDAYYNPGTEKTNIAELIIAKQRNGPTGTIELTWLGEYAEFRDKAPEFRG